MKLAEAIQTADKRDVEALGEYLVGQFEITERSMGAGDPPAATGASIASALAAWAYMKLHAQDQGD